MAIGLFAINAATAQDQQITEQAKKEMKEGAFRHLDIGLTAGTTGIGVDVAMPINEMFTLRAGATFVPHFEKKLPFHVEVGEATEKEYQDFINKGDFSETGNREPSFSEWKNYENKRRFNKLSGLLKDFTGIAVDETIDMVGEPTYNQAKVLVDIHPFKNYRNWHLTAGVYFGNSKIAKATNSMQAMVSLCAVNMYNSMYWNAFYEQPFYKFGDLSPEFPPQISKSFKSYGTMAMRIGEFKEDFYARQDMYYSHDVYDMENYNEDGTYILLHKRGEIEYHKGDLMYHKGDTYRIIPDRDNLMKAYAKVNPVRPYIGIGYDGAISKDKKTTIGFNCGMLFWGGVPKVYTHDGVDMMHDLKNVNGQVGKYLDLMSNFPVYPLAELRIAHRIF